MRNILTTILIFAALTVAAQNYSPCYKEKYEAGVALYNKGDYNGAKAKFVAAKGCPMPNTAQADEWIKKCNSKLNPTPKTPQPAASIPKTDQTFTVNGISFKMVYVQGGTFTMGCPYEDSKKGKSSEKPKHQVTVSDFLMGETEVTQALWEAVMGTTVREQRDKEDPSKSIKGEGASYPMFFVSWNEAVAFCKKLNEMLQSQLPLGCRFALPTEAQWEYAARGGNKSQHFQFAGSNTADDVAWHTSNSGDKVHPVRTKSPNELDLYDMSGNIYEWCTDWYGSYRSSAQTNPKGLSSGSERVLRGGVWCWGNYDCLVYSRFSDSPGKRSSVYGFRLSLVGQ